MKKKRRNRILICSLLILIILLALYFVNILKNKSVLEETTKQKQNLENLEVEEKNLHEEGIKVEAEPTEELEEKEDTRIPISVQEISASRVSKQEIEISWSDDMGDLAEQYIVKRRNLSKENGSWEIVKSINLDEGSKEETIAMIDELETSNPQQYEYRVDILPIDDTKYKGIEGKSVIASNIMICIDPGHYAGVNAVTGEESYGYAEGDFTIQIALELKRILKEEYGIDSVLTRDTDSITINGYTNAKLDSKNLTLRGEYTAEKDCDLFLSIHTNANEVNANGFPTCMQPIGINKPVLLINMVGMNSQEVISVGNAIGTNLAKINYELGISEIEEFITVEADNIEEWTKSKNDQLNVPGTIYCRIAENEDYYGVLRGASNVNKPGIIIEHGYHTVAEVRREAMQGDLKTLWAEADAYGIAYGYGFVTGLEMK